MRLCLLLLLLLGAPLAGRAQGAQGASTPAATLRLLQRVAGRLPAALPAVATFGDTLTVIQTDSARVRIPHEPGKLLAPEGKGYAVGLPDLSVGKSATCVLVGHFVDPAYLAAAVFANEPALKTSWGGPVNSVQFFRLTGTAHWQSTGKAVVRRGEKNWVELGDLNGDGLPEVVLAGVQILAWKQLAVFTRVPGDSLHLAGTLFGQTHIVQPERGRVLEEMLDGSAGTYGYSPRFQKRVIYQWIGAELVEMRKLTIAFEGNTWYSQLRRNWSKLELTERGKLVAQERFRTYSQSRRRQRLWDNFFN